MHVVFSHWVQNHSATQESENHDHLIRSLKTNETNFYNKRYNKYSCNYFIFDTTTFTDSNINFGNEVHCYEK